MEIVSWWREKVQREFTPYQTVGIFIGTGYYKLSIHAKSFLQRSHQKTEAQGKQASLVQPLTVLFLPFFFPLESSKRRENPKGQHRNCIFNSKGCSCIWGILTWGIEVTCSETHRTTRNISRSHLGKHPLSCQKNDWELLSVQPAPWHYGIITCPTFWCSHCLGFIYRLTGTKYVR